MIKRRPAGKRPEFRIIFLDSSFEYPEEYLKHGGFETEEEALYHMKGIAPSRKPQLLKVIAGHPPDKDEP